jgi:hypothetical protein
MSGILAQYLKKLTDMYMNIHHNIIQNNPKVEKAKCPTMNEGTSQIQYVCKVE